MNKHSQSCLMNTGAKQQLQGGSGMAKVTDSIILAIGKTSPSREDFIAFQPVSMQQASMRSMIVRGSKDYPDVKSFRDKEIYGPLEHSRAEVEYSLNADYDPRSIVSDDSLNLVEAGYGNADATGPEASHGTHVAGIIGAVRNNGEGMDGVADNVRIMSIRAIPQGDERDKDVANAIRYAVDNEAKIINMSFGKHFSPHKAIVDEAVKHAMKKDVLIVPPRHWNSPKPVQEKESNIYTG